MQMSNHCSQIMMLRSKLKTKLDPMRYEHSLSVSFTCMNLAMRYGYDIDKAELAGLMHDCGKRFADEIILKKCISHKIPVTDAEMKHFRYFTPSTVPGWLKINMGSKIRRS